MSEKTALTEIRKKYGSSLLDVYEHNDNRAYVTIQKKDITGMCKFLSRDLGGRLAIITAMDTRSGVEILYHFMFPGDVMMITLKTKVKKPSLDIDSVATFYPAANWIEREIADFLGVRFEGHPDPRRILMADDWPDDVYPYRRDYKGIDR